MLDMTIRTANTSATIPLWKASTRTVNELMEDAYIIEIEDEYSIPYAILCVNDRVEIHSDELMGNGVHSLVLKPRKGNWILSTYYMRNTQVLLTNEKKIKKIVQIIREEAIIRGDIWAIGPRLRRFINRHLKKTECVTNACW